MIHQRVTVNQSFSSLDDINVVVAESHPVPKDIAFSAGCMVLFPVSTLANNVLYSVDLLSAVHRINHDVLLVLRRAHHHYLPRI